MLNFGSEATAKSLARKIASTLLPSELTHVNSKFLHAGMSILEGVTITDGIEGGGSCAGSGRKHRLVYSRFIRISHDQIFEITSTEVNVFV